MTNTPESPRRAHFRAGDGALVGWRYWLVFRAQPDELVSPVQHTHWEGPVLSAHAWSTAAAVEGVAGIHAAHTQKQARYRAVMARTRRGWGRDICTVAFGRVRGYGNYVIGVHGWRAQRVIVDKLFIAPFPGQDVRSVLDALENRYGCTVRVALLPDLRRCSRTFHSCARCGHAISQHRISDGICVLCAGHGPCAGEAAFRFARIA
jgi:hypothetical protein